MRPKSRKLLSKMFLKFRQKWLQLYHPRIGSCEIHADLEPLLFFVLISRFSHWEKNMTLHKNSIEDWESKQCKYFTWPIETAGLAIMPLMVSQCQEKHVYKVSGERRMHTLSSAWVFIVFCDLLIVIKSLYGC